MALLGLPQSHHCLATKSQQRVQPFIDVQVRCQQFAEVAGLVQALLVVTHSGFHQQHADLDFHLHHLAHQQAAKAHSISECATFRAAARGLR
jgi:hypothetical protein